VTPRRAIVLVAVALVASATAALVATARAERALAAKLDELAARVEEVAQAADRATARPLRCAAIVDGRDVAAQILTSLGPRAAPAPAVAEVAAVRSPELLALLERGRRLVADARAARRWSDADVAALESLSPGLDEPAYQELAAELADAINSGAVEVATTGPPL
jgi:hypothetical protein